MSPSKSSSLLMPRVLVVDDDHSFCQMIDDALGESYDLVFAYDGEQGHRLARRERPDVILLDLMLPKLSGKSLGFQFENDPFFTGVPVVYCTANVEEAENAGDRPVLLKPFSVKDLKAVLSESLGRAPRTLDAFVPVTDPSRYGPHYPVHIPLQMVMGEGEKHAGRLVSASLWGGLVAAPESIAIGQEGYTNIVDRDGILQLGCRVLCAAEWFKRHHVGLRFHFDTDDEESGYRQLLARHGAPFIF